MLIAWSRLLDGRWRDPLVGRDVLIGGAVALAVQAANGFSPAILGLRGMPAELPSFQTAGWMGSRLALAQVLAWIPGSVWVSLSVVVLLVLFRIVLRRELTAALGVGAVFVAIALSAPNAAGVDWLIALPLAVINFAPLIVIPTRFGLMMFVAFTFAGRAATGLAMPAFASGAVALILIAMVVPGVFGFYTATRGRKASGWLD